MPRVYSANSYYKIGYGVVTLNNETSEIILDLDDIAAILADLSGPDFNEIGGTLDTLTKGARRFSDA